MFNLDSYSEPGFRVIDSQSVLSVLKNSDELIVDIIKNAYIAHHLGQSNLPHSVFLRFQENSRNRIIGLPAYIGGQKPLAGFKWIASFPENNKNKLDRASAVMILNSMSSGYPKAVIESSIISAKRTAASAALASLYLHDEKIQSMGLVGCGLIGCEIIKFMLALHPSMQRIYIHDLSDERADVFVSKFLSDYPHLVFKRVSSMAELAVMTSVVALATTSSVPYIETLPDNAQIKLILNVSLRDLHPEIILNSINVVDDVDHVCREKTSVHLAELQVNNRGFISATLAEVIQGEKILPKESRCPIVFSPFGLGVLDLVLAEYVYEECICNNLGIGVNNFFPLPWGASDVVIRTEEIS